jgi:site-specific recombinase XerD
VNYPQRLKGKKNRIEVIRMKNDSAWLEDSTVQQWFKKIDNERTIKNYTWEFPKFLKFIQMQPKDMVQQRLDQLATNDPIKRRFFEDKYVEYKHTLENAELRKNTVKSYLRTVQSFFANNNVKLILTKNDTKVRTKDSDDIVPTQWTPSNEEIRVLYRMAQNARDRAILLTLYSGYSEVDVASMQIQQFPFYDQNGNWQIPITEDLYHARLRSKTKILQQSVISRECLEEIRIMLQSRGFPKEGYLFVSFRDKPLGVRGINDAMKEIVQRAFNGKAKEWETKHLRDAFMNALEKAKIPQKIADVMVGHKPEGSKSSYEVQQETIMTLYPDVFKFLTINSVGSQSRKLEEIDAKFTEQLKALTDIITELKTERDGLKTELREIRTKIDLLESVIKMSTEKKA